MPLRSWYEVENFVTNTRTQKGEQGVSAAAEPTALCTLVKRWGASCILQELKHCTKEFQKCEFQLILVGTEVDNDFWKYARKGSRLYLADGCIFQGLKPKSSENHVEVDQ